MFCKAVSQQQQHTKPNSDFRKYLLELLSEAMHTGLPKEIKLTMRKDKKDKKLYKDICTIMKTKALK